VGRKKTCCISEQKGALGWFRRAESSSKVWKIYEKDEHTWEFTDLRQMISAQEPAGIQEMQD